MSDIRATVIEQNYPPVRRNTVSGGIVTNLRCTVPSYLNMLEGGDLSSPKKSSTIRDSQEIIAIYYRKIHTIIEMVDELITKRLENHQNQVFSIVKSQIEEMKQQTEDVVQKLNIAIADKNTEDQIWILSNQLDYFKSETFKLFQSNKKLRADLQIQKKRIAQYKIQLQNNDLLMQKLKKSYFKQKMIKQKLMKTFKSKLGQIQIEPITFNPQQIQAAIQSHKRKKVKQNIKTQPRQHFQSAISMEPARKSQIYELAQRQSSRVIITLAEDEDQSSLRSQKQERKSIQNQEQFQTPINMIKNQILPEVIQKQFTDKIVQTEQQYQSFKKLSEDHDYTHDRTSVKNIDFIKNGFFINSYDEKNKKFRTQPSMNKNRSPTDKQKPQVHADKMQTVFNKSKIRYQKQQFRMSLNKTSMK